MATSKSPRRADDTTPIEFIVHAAAPAASRGAAVGLRGAAPAALPAGLVRGRVKHSVRLGATRGAPGAEQRVVAEPGRDVVVLHLAGGPSLVLHPAHARDLLRAQQVPAARGTASASSMAPNEVKVPVELRWPGLEGGVPAARGATRGVVGNVLLAGLEIVTGAAGDGLADGTAARIAARVDAQVEPGLYLLAPGALTRLKGSAARPVSGAAVGAASAGPLLVFVHGTFSNSTAFAALWARHPQRVGALFARYDSRVFGFEHPTLTVSPVANALALAKALPRGAQLHLVTHSRGGLVAEVLARAAANPELAGEDTSRLTKDDARDLTALAAECRAKGLRVTRVVRVAAPIRGTLLASKRLDAYLSVFKWSLELAGVPVLPEVVELLSAVAQRRADPMLMPGLAAQIPGSPLIEWLHAADEPLPGDLRVIAGDVQGDSVVSWLKTLLADGFYWTDNDFVVQTRSMYGGAARAGGASFLLDRGARVAHTAYFANERTAEATCNALLHERPEGFAPIGPLSWAGESSTGTRGARAARATDERSASAKPAAILLPGILGSHLAADGKRIWLGFRVIGGLKRLAYPDTRGTRVTPDGAIGPIYDDLAEHLAATHEVIEFSYDWRRPIEDEAKRLAQVVEAALVAREGSGAPVRFVAHSMGGLVVRTMALEAPEVFERAMARPGARVLMLGTPNGGSWAPMTVLSGDDSFGNTLAAFGAPFQDRAARQLMAQFPGFLQLQAQLTDPALKLDQSSTWAELAARDEAAAATHSGWHSDPLQLGAYAWGVPPQPVLDRARALRERLDAQRDGELARFAEKIVLVVGAARFTPDGYELGAEGLAYLNATDAGDGRVTQGSARLPGVRTWAVGCEHGSLPDHEKSFAAYTELLESGHTTRLQRLPDIEAGTRAAAMPAAARAAYVRSRPSRQGGAPRPPERQTELGALSAAAPERTSAEAAMPALAISVVNANLMFIRQPLLVGHYRATQLTGSEGAVNSLIGGAMAESLGAGVYPDGAGAFQMFRNTRGSDNPLQLPRPEWAIVVGLGDESELKPASLVHSVRQAIIGWAQRITEGGTVAEPTFELAATLVGSGGTRITPGQSAQLVAQAAREANVRLRATGWPRLAHLVFVELYLDRASEAWRALQVLADTRPQDWRIEPEVSVRAGALRRPLDAGYRGADYDLVSATSTEGRGYDAAINYTLDTRRARTEVRAQATQARLVREIVKRASNDRNQDPQIGRTLYQLLVPVEMDPFLGGTTEVRIELDAGTAGIPWELLHNAGGDNAASVGSEEALPWSIRTRLIRKLRTVRFRQTVRDAGADSGVLVIGEPAVTEVARYPRLPGARREANAVVERLTGSGALDEAAVTALIAPDDEGLPAPDAHQVINALLERDWRIVHIAGHGEPPERITAADGSPRSADPRGVVLSHGCFLGPREIGNMRVVPELVFVNCCHLGERANEQLLQGQESERDYDRVQFAAGVAEELIKIGVRCVIAAGWAVEDGPAETFATTFYDALLAGARFIDAAARARRAAWEERGSGNTWAAYQCYGDPEWTLRPAEGRTRVRAPAERFAGISSPLALAIALETVAVESRFLRADERDRWLPTQRDRLAYLESRFGPLWGGMGAVAEAFAVACNEQGDTTRAISWYERAVAANDASASQKAAEQLANLLARAAEGRVQRVDRQRDRAATKKAAEGARGPLGKALISIEQLIAMHPTLERHAIAGSACKRLALVERAAGADAKALDAVRRMKVHYVAAESIARAADDTMLYYPALNRMAAELVTDAAEPGWPGFDRADIAAVRQRLAARTRDDPDFWSVAGLTELRLYEAVASKHLAAEVGAIGDEYADLHRRVSGTNYWRSLFDTARFVLDRYAERAGAADKRACKVLLAALDTFAWPR